MPNACRNHHHVAGADFVALAVLQRSAIDAWPIQVADRWMVRRAPLGIYYGASRDKRSGTLHHVVDLRHLVVLDGLLRRFLGAVDCADRYVDFANVNHANLLI